MKFMFLLVSFLYALILCDATRESQDKYMGTLEEPATGQVLVANRNPIVMRVPYIYQGEDEHLSPFFNVQYKLIWENFEEFNDFDPNSQFIADFVKVSEAGWTDLFPLEDMPIAQYRGNGIFTIRFDKSYMGYMVQQLAYIADYERIKEFEEQRLKQGYKDAPYHKPPRMKPQSKQRSYYGEVPTQYKEPLFTECENLLLYWNSAAVKLQKEDEDEDDEDDSGSETDVKDSSEREESSKVDGSFFDTTRIYPYFINIRDKNTGESLFATNLLHLSLFPGKKDAYEIKRDDLFRDVFAVFECYLMMADKHPWIIENTLFRLQQSYPPEMHDDLHRYANELKVYLQS